MDKVRRAIVTALLPLLEGAPLSLPSDAIVTENMPKPDAAKFAEILFKPNNPIAVTLGPGGLDLLTGVMLVNLHLPLNTGSAEGLAAIRALRVTLSAGTALIFEGQTVTITMVGGNVARIVDTWSRTDISINWRAFLKRGVD